MEGSNENYLINENFYAETFEYSFVNGENLSINLTNNSYIIRLEYTYPSAFLNEDDTMSKWWVITSIVSAIQYELCGQEWSETVDIQTTRVLSDIALIDGSEEDKEAYQDEKILTSSDWDNNIFYTRYLDRKEGVSHFIVYGQSEKANNITASNIDSSTPTLPEIIEPSIVSQEPTAIEYDEGSYSYYAPEITYNSSEHTESEYTYNEAEDPKMKEISIKLTEQEFFNNLPEIEYYEMEEIDDEYANTLDGISIPSQDENIISGTIQETYEYSLVEETSNNDLGGWAVGLSDEDALSDFYEELYEDAQYKYPDE